MRVKEVFPIVKSFVDVEQPEQIWVRVVKGGLINSSFKIELESGSKYILQKLNNLVFEKPFDIQKNIAHVSKHLISKNYGKHILVPVQTRFKKLLHFDEEGGAWRMFSFIEDTDCHSVVLSVDYAFEAAKSLGEFHMILSDFDANKLFEPIPEFLNFQLRKDRFDDALINGDGARIGATQPEISKIKKYAVLLDNYQALIKQLPIRVIHADPKISNFLFKKNATQVAGIIDLDTLMPGSVLYDFGDMVRSFTNLKEEDDCANSPTFNSDYYHALLRGYLVYQENVLCASEKENLLLGAKTVVYVQAIRFITDYLLGDKYYHTTYDVQNRNRAVNQLNLLEGIMEWEG